MEIFDKALLKWLEVMHKAEGRLTWVFIVFLLVLCLALGWYVNRLRAQRNDVETTVAYQQLERDAKQLIEQRAQLAEEKEQLQIKVQEDSIRHVALQQSFDSLITVYSKKKTHGKTKVAAVRSFSAEATNRLYANNLKRFSHLTR